MNFKDFLLLENISSRREVFNRVPNPGAGAGVRPLKVARHLCVRCFTSKFQYFFLDLMTSLLINPVSLVRFLATAVA